MKVTLVFPCIRNYGGFNSLGKHADCVFVNHGLASLAAVLQKQDHEVSLIDLRECHDWNDFQRKVQFENANYYGVYMQTLDYHEAVYANKIIQKLGYKTIVGGPHPSIASQQVLDETSFNYVFVGEGEVTLPQLIEHPEKFSRLVVGEHPNLDSLPYENREVFNMKKVLATKNSVYSSPFVSIIVGRGCTFGCSFCKPGEDKIFGSFRIRSVKHLMGEIELLRDKYNYATLMIDDDSFTLKPNYVRDFCDSYEKIGRPFVTQSRADFIVRNPVLVKRLAQVGLRMFIIGFESGNQRILNLYRKGTTVDMNIEAAKICHKYGVKVWANYILGAPTETKKETEDTFKMLHKIKPDYYSPSFYTPIVGTYLYDFCKKNNLLLSHDVADVGSRSPNTPKIKGQDYEWLHKKMASSLHRDFKYQFHRVTRKVRKSLA
jgi:anaerobic magnesium-protoporphyrin IX monomethyl ester cyclase